MWNSVYFSEQDVVAVVVMKALLVKRDAITHE